MELKHIPLDQLHPAPINMRHSKRAPDISDILPSVRARGILQPLLVRPNNEGFEIVAGRRRYYSAKVVEAEQGSFAPIPCAVMEPGDDAAALEASLIENVARLDADEMTEYETFFRLIKEGRTVEGIAATFGKTEKEVRQRLALGNLLPKIREAYRAEQIDGETLRHLTLASKAQQKAWLDMFETDEQNAPFGYQLKQWLFGGQSISTKAALFAVEDYTGQIVTDLFGEESYFADSDLFWQMQSKAVEAKREALLAAKWPGVVVLETGARFNQWEFEKTRKKQGGKVFITVSHRGEVEIFEGYLSRKEARKSGSAGKDKQPVSAPAERPSMTQAMENYLDLHRHAAVRLSLLKAPETAMRLLIAHAVASSGNWNVRPDPQRSRSNEIAASIEKSAAQIAFDKERDAVMALLDMTGTDDMQGDEDKTATVFKRLLALSDSKVMRIGAFAMADTLAAGGIAVEIAGTVLKTDPRGTWQPDDAFFSLIRERATLTGMVAEVAGKAVATSNASEKTATLKQIICDALAGKNGRAKADNWLPGWMAFPFKGYGKGASRLAEQASFAAKLLRRA